MQPRTWKTPFFAIILILFCTFTPAPSQAAFNDIENNWAQKAILALAEEGIFKDLWEGEFLPHGTLDHETALELAARTLDLGTEEKEKLASWLSQTLVPSPEGITRGEFAALLANPLGLGEHTAPPSGWYPSFVDLGPDYPGFLAVEVLQRLSLLPSHLLGRFEPYRLITRSEAAAILESALRLKSTEGSLLALDEEQKQLIIQTSQEGNLELSLPAEPLVISPKGLSRDFNFKENDSLQALINEENKALLIQVKNEEKSRAALWETLDNALEILADVLTPTQVAAIISGDWEQLSEEIRYELYQELVNRGIAPWEAEALLKQDWTAVQDMAKERLTQEGAEYLQVAPELVHAALTRDWPKLLEYAQVELAERVLSSDWLKGAGNP
ncbi:MAG: S-layer homology domain-containing protein [Firmicutes bacterium]|nr:S-layer homology domain-containing protein [Bacillota bacterium]